MSKVQILRRTVQVTVLSFMIVAPLLGLYDILIENYRIHNVAGTFWQDLFYRVDDLVRKISDDPMGFADMFKGSTWSVTIAGYNVTDPLAFVGVTLGGGGFYLALFLSALPLIVLTVLLGRVFCGWICPMHLLFELNGKLRRVLGLIGVRPFNISFNRYIKYLMLLTGGVLSLALGVQVMTFIYPPAILNRELIHLIYFGSVGIGATLLLLLFFIEISLSERTWCRYFCPGGALWSLMGACRVVSVVRDPGLCDDCGDCDRACEFGLSPMKDRTGMECDNCGKCIAACSGGSLS
ncbi:MAG TPA: 4Fe-4S binding protein, partial [Deltaproteobacteria bacterium]|nr:4Fe-4S binding protein [Deltaproteobacteria bacterium]